MKQNPNNNSPEEPTADDYAIIIVSMFVVFAVFAGVCGILFAIVLGAFDSTLLTLGLILLGVAIYFRRQNRQSPSADLVEDAVAETKIAEESKE